MLALLLLFQPMRKLFICFFILISVLSVNAQNNSSATLPRSLRSGQTNNKNNADRNFKFFVGGNVNNNFGYNLALAPEIGIQPFKWLRIGVGPRYELQVWTDNAFNRYATHAVGASAFLEGIIINRILVHVGYEFLNYPTNIAIVPDPTSRRGYSLYSERDNLHSCALGVGYYTQVAQNLSFYALYVIYPFLTPNDYYSPLPMFARVGISYLF